MTYRERVYAYKERSPEGYCGGLGTLRSAPTSSLVQLLGKSDEAYR